MDTPQDPIEVVILAKVAVEFPDGTLRNASAGEQITISRRSADYLMRTKRARLPATQTPDPRPENHV